MLRYLIPYYLILIFSPTRINTQLPTFYSYHPDPGGTAVNAFSVDWANIAFYCFPLFYCVGKDIQTIITENATGILIVPNWSKQICHTLLYDILICDPFIIPPRPDHLHLPNRPLLSHPLAKNVVLMACLVYVKTIFTSYLQMGKIL